MTLTRRNLLTGLLAAVTLPHLAGARSLTGNAELLIADAGLDADVAFVVRDALSGQMLSSRNADRPLPPASTLKLITALYVLDRLGPAHRFRTRVLRDGDTLILAGGGDPELDTNRLAELAKAATGDAKRMGRPAPSRFLVWGGALPHIREISPGQAVHLPYNPTVSGMILNFNRVHLGWRRGDKGLQFSLEARGAGQSPRAWTIGISATERGQPLFTYDDSGDKEQWSIARSATGRSGSRWLPVRRPELYAGDVFQTLCRAQGLVLPSPEVADTIPAGEVVAELESAALVDIVDGMLEYSNNLTAEVLGLAASGRGDLRQSALAMQDWLRGKGVGGTFSFADHSGLSPDSRVTAQVLVDTITGPGRAQPLQSLLKHIPLRDAKGKEMDSPIRVDAKTGTLNFVSNLAGYAREGSGRLLAFSILTVNEPRRAASVGQELPDGVSTWTSRSKRLQQKLVENWVADFPGEMPDLAAPMPRGAGDLQFPATTTPVIRPSTMNSGVFR